MEFKHVMGVIHYGAFGMIIGMAVYGIYSALLVKRQISRRRFRNDEEANEFLGRLGDSLRRGKFDEAESLCTAPEYWYKALPLLAQLAIEKRSLPIPKIKQAIAARFTREVLTGLESLLASINLVVKAEPMLGLLGTVVGMIGAFSTIATMQHPNPQDLMKDLSVALNATAMGLSVAIPMLLVANFFQVRIRKFEDETYEQIQTLLEQMDASAGKAVRGRGELPARFLIQPAGEFASMAGDGTRRRSYEHVHIDFTPMIDCMFLLLMFNMVAYTITGSGDIDMPEAHYASGADAPDATKITLLQTKTGGDTEIHLGDAADRLVTLSEVKAEIAKAFSEGRNKVVIKAEPKVPYRMVHQIGQAVSSVDGGGGIILLTVKQPRGGSPDS